jgi:hypothetical protein
LRFTWFSDLIGIAASSSLKIIPFGLKCTGFFPLLIYSVLLSNFLFTRSPLCGCSYWAQFSLRLFPEGLCLCYSVLFPKDPDRRCCVQQGSYFRLRGTGGIQSFCFTPVCISVIVFVSFSIAAVLCFNLFRSEPCYSYILCVSKGFCIHLHESGCSFAEIFHLLFRCSLIQLSAEASFWFYYSA